MSSRQFARRSTSRRALVLTACVLLSGSLVAATSAAGGGGRGPVAKPGSAEAGKARAARQARIRARAWTALLRGRKPERPKPQLPAVDPAPPAPQPPGPPPTGPAAESRFGVSPDNIEFEEPEVRDELLDSLAAMGARWIRFDVKWEVIQHDGSGSYDFSRYDELTAAARARGFKILGTLAYAPPWARSAACASSFMCEPRNANEYATWAGRTVEHFKGRISHWEIWNEPNISGFWKPKPNPVLYTALVKAAYPRIKAADSDAFVLAGATSPAPNDGTQIDEVTFLEQVYANGGRGFFDAWSHHPYTHPAPPGNVHPDCAWYQIYGTKVSIRSLMAANGDAAKQVWGTEYGPPSSGSPGSVGEDGQARHVTDAYRLWRSYDWAGPLFWYTGRDLSAPGESESAWEYMGLLRRDLTPKPAYTAYKAAASG